MVPIIFGLVAIILLVYACNLFNLVWKTFFQKEAPFVPLPAGILELVAAEMAITTGKVVYDLGCGDGRVLFYLAKKYPTGQYVGVEKNWIPFALSKINFVLRGRPKNISILKKDMSACDYSAATHVFTYLFPEHMDRIYDKLERELPKGALLFSCAFRFKRSEPVKVIEIPQPGAVPTLHKKIFIYEF